MQQTTDSSMKSMYPGDRRKNPRYPIAGVARFQWRSSDGRWREGKGVTCDISKRGAFIATGEIPSVATALRIEVALPVVWQKDGELRLCGTGSVRHRRLDTPTEGYGAFVMFHADSRSGAGRGDSPQVEMNLGGGQEVVE